MPTGAHELGEAVEVVWGKGQDGRKYAENGGAQVTAFSFLGSLAICEAQMLDAENCAW